MSTFTFRRGAVIDGVSFDRPYRVCDPATGAVLAIVVRTRRGWDGFTPAGDLVVEDYPGSRAVAAGNAVARSADLAADRVADRVARAARLTVADEAAIVAAVADSLPDVPRALAVQVAVATAAAALNAADASWRAAVKADALRAIGA